jgi:hypothetical protein
MPLFLSDRFRHCFVQKLDEMRPELHFLLVGWVLMPEPFHVPIRPEPAETTPLIMKARGLVRAPGDGPQLEILLLGGSVNSPHGWGALS